MTLEVEGAKPIYQFIANKPKELTEHQLRRERDLIRTFGRIVGKMHAAGIFHGDLRLGNILARYEQDNWQFFFLDNERTKKFHRLPARLRLKNLVQVNMWRSSAIFNTDRMRFFEAYISANPCVQKRYNRWAQKIIAKTNCRLRKKNWFEN